MKYTIMIICITLQYVHSNRYFVDQACKNLYKCMKKMNLGHLSTKYDMASIIYPTVYMLLDSKNTEYSMASAVDNLENVLCNGLSERDMQLIETSEKCKSKANRCLDNFVSAIKNPSCFKLYPRYPQINENGDVTDEFGNVCYKKKCFEKDQGMKYFGIFPKRNRSNGKSIENSVIFYEKKCLRLCKRGHSSDAI